MEDFEILFEFARPSFISDLNVRRECDQGIATVTIEVSEGAKARSIILVGLNDFDSIQSLLDSERVRISKEVGCQREFGSVRVECFNDDGYAEHWCDSSNE